MSDTTIDLVDNIPGANITYAEVLEIGTALLNWTASVGRLGHASPGSTLDYTRVLDSIPALIVRDFVAWTSGRTHLVPGDPAERLNQLLAAAGWEAMVVDSMPLTRNKAVAS